MDEKTGKLAPLLSTKDDDNKNITNNIHPPKKIPFLLSSTKWVLRVKMWVIFIAWVASIFHYPFDPVINSYLNLTRPTIVQYPFDLGNLFGVKGSIFITFSAPIFVIAFLAIAYIVVCAREQKIYGFNKPSSSGFRLRTFPVLVDGPFGVVSAAEMIGIVIFAAYVICAFIVFTVKNTGNLSRHIMPTNEWSMLMLKNTGRDLGLIGVFCLAFLFLPVSRGSIILRLIDIPFEHATKYHVWLGHLTMSLFTLHGLLFSIAWGVEGQLILKLTEWLNIGVAKLPGVISLLAGLLMWVTSLPGVRRVNFELFLYTHQLYIVFVFFLALHVGDFIFCFAAGGIFLFMLDRYLRFCQSRKKVDVVSARCFPCGTMELVLSKPANLNYNALGSIFLQICELSWLQWHPFSVSSSPLGGKHRIAVLIKGLGDWTQKLERRISEMGPQTVITASVEGPYGHESPYHLTYKNLILVAGGIGISPFLAILSDVLHRINDGKPCLPKNILIIWAVKTSDELSLLQTVDIDSICPNFSDMLNLEIQTYVTRQSEPLLEEGKAIEPVNSVFSSKPSKKRRMSVLAGTGNIIWSGMYVIISTVGWVITATLLDVLYVNPYGVYQWWYKGLLFFACMVVSVLVFGGLVIGLWHLWERRTSDREFEETVENEPIIQKNRGKEQYVSTIRYGQRPDFGGIFETMSDHWGKEDIGVIICGPPTLETSVAKECRTQNLKRGGNRPIFHFNSHSFDL